MKKQHTLFIQKGEGFKPKTFYTGDDLYRKLEGAPYPSPEEEIGLADRARAGDDEARNKLIVQSLGIIIPRLWKLVGPIPDRARFQDLFQEAAIGIIHAAPRYKQRGGACFAVYANWWIMKMVYIFLHQEKRINVSEMDYRLAIKYSRAVKRLLEAGEDSSVENIATHLDLEIEDVLQRKRDYETGNFVSFEDLATKEGGAIEYHIEDKHADDYLLDFEASQQHDVLVSRMRRILKPHHFEVIDELFGITDENKRIGGIELVARARGTGKVNIWRQEQRAFKMLQDDLVIKEISEESVWQKLTSIKSWPSEERPTDCGSVERPLSIKPQGSNYQEVIAQTVIEICCYYYDFPIEKFRKKSRGRKSCEHVMVRAITASILDEVGIPWTNIGELLGTSHETLKRDLEVVESRKVSLEFLKEINGLRTLIQIDTNAE